MKEKKWSNSASVDETSFHHLSALLNGPCLLPNTHSWCYFLYFLIPLVFEPLPLTTQVYHQITKSKMGYKQHFHVNIRAAVIYSSVKKQQNVCASESVCILIMFQCPSARECVI